MHVFQNRHGGPVVVVFGSGGVVGSALQRQLAVAGYQATAACAILWAQPVQDISTQIDACLKRPALTQAQNKKLVVVWAAGAAGFGSSEQDTQKELAVFTAVLDQLQEHQLKIWPQTRLRFLLISSIGGLFEGITNIRPDSPISVRRPYGQLKQAQEQLIATQEGLSAGIIRLPSVYSYINVNKRMGLIQTMTRNALLRQITPIFGSPTTLRDYVWADDIGRTVVHLCGADTLSTQPYHLFSGRPASILYIHACLERCLGRSVHLSFHYEAHNALNITGHRVSYNGMWQPTDMTENITRIVDNALSQHI